MSTSAQRISNKSAPLKLMEKRANQFANETRKLMLEAGHHRNVDDAALALLGYHMARLESLPELGLELPEQLKLEQSITSLVIRLRSHLGLSKDQQRRANARPQGGRPTKSESQWADIDV